MQSRRMTLVVWVVGALLGLGGPTVARAAEVWVPPTHFLPPALSNFPWPTSGSGLASFGFAVPDDFATLRAATVALVPKANVSGSFDVYASVKREGELAGSEILFNLAIPANLTAGTVQEIDLTSLVAPHLDASSAGSDYVSVFFRFPASPGLENANVLGLRFTYDPARITSIGLENGSVTTEKIATGAVSSDKVANNSLTSVDIANSSIRLVDVDRNEIQARVTGSCPEGKSIRSIGPGGEVDCDSRPLVIVPEIVQVQEVCGPNELCEVTVSCPSGRVVTGGGYYFGPAGAVYDIRVYGSRPGSAGSWKVNLHNRYDHDTHNYFYAICAYVGYSGLSASAAAPPLAPKQ